jgi:hypothetical protein
MSSRRSFSFFKKKKPEETLKADGSLSDIAMKIIEKELELENFWEPKVIHELIGLYSKVIEHYEQNNNPKYYDFQDRMHKMLIKPKVISALQRINCKDNFIPDPLTASPTTIEINPTVHQISPTNVESSANTLDRGTYAIKIIDTEIPIEPPDITSPMDIRKEQSEKNRKKLSKELNKTLAAPKSHKNLNVIIDRHSSTSKVTAQKAVADFKSQDSALEKRLASRKKFQLTRSMTFASYTSRDFTRVFGCDLSDVDEENNSSTKSSFFITEEQSIENYEKFEKRLEEIMERNFSERAMKIAEIKFKYESQISEIYGMGDFMELLIKQMRMNMQEEIDTVVQEYDIKRKEEIRLLKEEVSA